jgi:carbonic anhydrase
MNLSQLFIAITFVLMLSCNNSTPAVRPANTATDSLSKSDESHNARPVHWSYSEHGGPADWAKLSPVYAACGSGHSQSPINLLTPGAKGSAEWSIDYKTTSLEIKHNEHVEELINNGHTIQVTTEKGSSIRYENKTYALKQFHFHSPSEHTIDGKNFPLEIHLVHQAADESLAVIAVLVQEGKHNINFDQLIKFLPDQPGEKIINDSVQINVGINVPKELDAYHYIGSLTTPPCTENVQWLVLKNLIQMDKEQLRAFSSRLKTNNRPVQSLNGRVVEVIKMKSSQ